MNAYKSWEERIGSIGDIQEKEWHDANVPGTLFMDMIREGRIQNPFYRFQEREFQELAQKDYEYELRFAVQEDVFFKRKTVFGV